MEKDQSIYLVDKIVWKKSKCKPNMGETKKADWCSQLWRWACFVWRTYSSHEQGEKFISWCARFWYAFCWPVELKEFVVNHGLGWSSEASLHLVKCHIDTVMLASTFVAGFCSNSIAMCFWTTSVPEKSCLPACTGMLASWLWARHGADHYSHQTRDCKICPVHLMLEAFKWKGSFPCHLYPYLGFNARP